jgi:hypothetical protein
MNTTTRKLRFEELETTLRDLDAAESTPLDARTDERARATLARIVASSGGPPSAGTTAKDRPQSAAALARRPMVRRVVAVGAVAAALAIGSVVAPNVFRGSQALAWSAKPQALAPEEARAAEEACDRWVHDGSRDSGGTDLSGLRPVITEMRGSMILVYETDSRPAPSDMTCYVQDGRVVASGGSAATAASVPLPPVAADSLHGELGAVFSTHSSSIRGVTGRVGANVVAVVLDSVARGPVTATVREGHFAAWWPDAPTTEAQESAATAPEITGATLTLRDGSARWVSVEELSGRTTEELSRPDTGGSASVG